MIGFDIKKKLFCDRDLIEKGIYELYAVVGDTTDYSPLMEAMTFLLAVLVSAML